MLKLTVENPFELYFSTDPHFFHQNVALKRHFDTAAEMNALMVREWNDFVPKHATVIMCGDFAAFNKTPRNMQKLLVQETIQKLNGKITFIRGNHDEDRWFKDLGIQLHDSALIKISGDNNQKVFCSHHAHIVWPGHHKGSWHVHGHSHGTLVYPFPDAKIIDVCVENHKFKPVSYSLLKERMSSRSVHITDHHSYNCEES